MLYTVRLDGVLKANGLTFADAIRVATDLSQSIGWRNFTSRVIIEATKGA